MILLIPHKNYYLFVEMFIDHYFFLQLIKNLNIYKSISFLQVPMSVGVSLSSKVRKNDKLWVDMATVKNMI